MENVAWQVQRMQLGASQVPTRRAISHNQYVAHFQSNIRRMLLPSLHNNGIQTYISETPSGNVVPIFQVAYANQPSTTHSMAAVDENGCISIINTSPLSSSSPPTAIAQSPARKWIAHDNAIFDLVWSQDDRQVYTASGDLRVCGWDVETQKNVFTLQAHRMSVKCVRQAPSKDHLVVSAARDGNVLLWDTRAPTKPTALIQNVHGQDTSPCSFISSSPSPRLGVVSPNRAKRRKTASSRHATPCSVTCLEWSGSGEEILTAGAMDGVVKFWDVRRLTSSCQGTKKGSLPGPVRTLSCASTSRGKRGITSMSLDPVTKTRLLVNILNDELRVFDIKRHCISPQPLVRCDGNVINSFYIKSTFSPDGDFILSGSGDGVVYVWNATTRKNIDEVLSPIVALKGHESDVNGVAWHPNEFTQLATCSDDGTVRLWKTDQRSLQDSRFHLCRQQQLWSNWSDFQRQRDGYAYEIECRNIEKKLDFESSTIIRRNPAILEQPNSCIVRSKPNPSKRITSQQTLLDLWQLGNKNVKNKK